MTCVVEEITVAHTVHSMIWLLDDMIQLLVACIILRTLGYSVLYT